MTKKKPIDIVRYKEVFGFPIEEYYRKAGVDFSVKSYSELADYFINEYQPRSLKECMLYPDVISFIDKAHEDGCKVVLCSASKLNLLIEQLESFGIYEKFDAVLGLDNHHAVSKIEIAKKYCKDHCTVNDEIYFLGDTSHDKETADAIGATPILVSRGHQSQEVLEETGAMVSPTLTDAYKNIINK